MIVWGGSIWNTEPYNLSLQLQVSTFPFLALLSCESERSVQILDRIQGFYSIIIYLYIPLHFKGFIDERTLVERLNTGMNQGRAQLNRTRTEQRRRFESILFTKQSLQYFISN